jgi:hypothetical protein
MMPTPLFSSLYEWLVVKFLDLGIEVLDMRRPPDCTYLWRVFIPVQQDRQHVLAMPQGLVGPILPIRARTVPWVRT